MKRTIKSFSSLTDQEKKLISRQYPYGFGPKDLSSLKTAQGQHLEVLEVRTEDMIYLVKISQDLLDEFYEPEQMDLGEEFIDFTGLGISQ